MDYEYDVIVIGAGPGGLATAHELSSPDLEHKIKVALLDKSSKFGGNGGNTDNKWNILKKDANAKTGFWHLLADRGGVWNREYVEDMTYIGMDIMKFLLKPNLEFQWKDLGVPDIYRLQPDAQAYWRQKLGNHDLTLEPLEQFHIGTNRGREVMQRWGQYIQKRSVDVHLNCEASSIEKLEDGRFKITCGSDIYYSNQIVLAPGRPKEDFGEDLLSIVAPSLGLDTVVNSIDRGIRLEFDNRAMLGITKWEGENGIYDPKIETLTPTGDPMRTFCSNLRGGHLSLEVKYVKGQKMVIVNGESSQEDHGVLPGNLAILETINLADPANNPIEWTLKHLDIIKHLTTGTNDSPRVLVQRMGDFLGPRFYELNLWLTKYEPGDKIESITFPNLFESNPRRSRFTENLPNSFNRLNIESGNPYFISTLDKRTYDGKGSFLGSPGNLRLAFDETFIRNLEVMLFRLGNVFPMLLSPATVIAGPEFKYYAQRAVADLFSETNIDGVYVVGDGGRGTHGIAPSVVNGFNAAQGISTKYYNNTLCRCVQGKKIEISPNYVGVVEHKI